LSAVNYQNERATRFGGVSGTGRRPEVGEDPARTQVFRLRMAISFLVDGVKRTRVSHCGAKNVSAGDS
jgi:hypothetical protein